MKKMLSLSLRVCRNWIPVFLLVPAGIVSTALLAVTPSAAAEAPWQGKGSGGFSVKSDKVVLKYAYCMEEPDPFNESATVISVLLTATPLPREAFNVDSLYFAMDKSKPSILYKVDSGGKTTSEVIIHPGIESGGVQLSGITAGELKLRDRGKERVSGSIVLQEGKASFHDFGYAVKAEFDAPLLRPPPKQPRLTAKTGKALPPGGGEPGQVFRTFLEAVRQNNMAVVRKMAPPDIAKASDEELVSVVKFLSMAIPKDAGIVKGFTNSDLATLYLSGTGDEGPEYGTITMLRRAGGWIIERQEWGNKPPKL